MSVLFFWEILCLHDTYSKCLYSAEEKTQFCVRDFLPAMSEATREVSLTLGESATLATSTAGTAAKLLYATVWQVRQRMSMSQAFR